MTRRGRICSSGLRGQRFLPPSQRPLTVVTREGRTIEPNRKKAKDNDKVMRAGTKIHRALEREIHPVAIAVTASTKEETWALRIYDMLANIDALMTVGTCVRCRIFFFTCLGNQGKPLADLDLWVATLPFLLAMAMAARDASYGLDQGPFLRRHY